MHLLTNNLTFAILGSNPDTGLYHEEDWRTDLTIRFCEYFSHQINPDCFSTSIIYSQFIDEAIETCTTDYLLIQEAGHIPFNQDFFEVLEQCAIEKTDIILGYIKLADDFLHLEKKCIFVNKLLWAQYGKPAYLSKVNRGPVCKVTIATKDKYHPAQLEVVPGEDQFVPGECSWNGAALLIKQLETFGHATSITGACSPDQYYFLDGSSPYQEIHTETFFERKYLSPFKNIVTTYNTENMNHIGDTHVDTLVMPGSGLKAWALAKHLKAKEVVIYDKSFMAIQLQKLIFGITEPTLYGDIIAELIKKLPTGYDLSDDWKEDKNVVIHPLKGLTFRYEYVECFSYQMEDLIKSINTTKSALFDLSDIFVSPYNFYRRPMTQVFALFQELYSLMKGRLGPTFIIGYAPRFQQMDGIKINTDNSIFESTIVVEEKKVDPAIIEQIKVEELAVKAEPVHMEIPAFPVSAKTNSDIARGMGYTVTTEADKPNSIFLKKSEILNNYQVNYEYSLNESSGVWVFSVGENKSNKHIEFSRGLSVSGFLKHLEKQPKVDPLTIQHYFK